MSNWTDEEDKALRILHGTHGGITQALYHEYNATDRFPYRTRNSLRARYARISKGLEPIQLSFNLQPPRPWVTPQVKDVLRAAGFRGIIMIDCGE